MTPDKSPKKTEAAPKAATSPTESAVKPDTAKSDTAKPDAAKPDAAKPDTAKPEAAKPEAGAPANYSRGEGQKPVTQAYKDNWNLIFGDKTSATPARSTNTKRKSAQKSATKTKAAKNRKR